MVAELSPTFERGLQFKSFRIAHRAIESHPRHDLGVGKVAATTPHFPNSLVGLLANSFQMLDEFLLLRPSRSAEARPCFRD